LVVKRNVAGSRYSIAPEQLFQRCSARYLLVAISWCFPLFIVYLLIASTRLGIQLSALVSPALNALVALDLIRKKIKNNV